MPALTGNRFGIGAEPLESNTYFYRFSDRTIWGIKNDESWQFYVKGPNFGYPPYFNQDSQLDIAYYEMLAAFYENIATSR